MKRTPGKVLVAQMMAEKVNHGGELIARGTLAVRMEKQGYEARCIDFFAFATRAVPPHEEHHFSVRCACGARWRGALMGTNPLPCCPSCEKA